MKYFYFPKDKYRQNPVWRKLNGTSVAIGRDIQHPLGHTIHECDQSQYSKLYHQGFTNMIDRERISTHTRRRRYADTEEE